MTLIINTLKDIFLHYSIYDDFFKIFYDEHGLTFRYLYRIFVSLHPKNIDHPAIFIE